jgi:hypothetical protein
MAKMKIDEQRYAMKRVDEIYKLLEEQVRQVNITKERELTEKEKKQQLRYGGADLKHVSNWSLTTPIGDCYDFDDTDAKPKLDQNKYRKAVDALRKEKVTITDEIMLGDAETAKVLLQRYEDKVKVS